MEASQLQPLLIGQVRLCLLLTFWGITASAAGSVPEWSFVKKGGRDPWSSMSFTLVLIESKADSELLMYGGYGAYQGENNAWSCDPQSAQKEFKLLCGYGRSGCPPGNRKKHTAIYAPLTKEMLLYGGGGGSPWSYNVSSKSWTQLGSTSSRWSLSGHSAVYSSVSGEMLVFGGDPLSSDLITFSVQSREWSVESFSGDNVPQQRFEHSAVFVEASGEMLIFGGRSSPRNLARLSDLWSFNVYNRTWRKIHPSGSSRAPAMSSHSAVFVSLTQEMVVFGGYQSSASDATWVFNLASNTWRRLQTSGTLPKARAEHAAVYSETTRQMLVLSGYPWNGDLWSLRYPVSSCAAGQYLDGDTCRNCSANTYDADPSWHADQCVQCPQGRYSAAGSTVCHTTTTTTYMTTRRPTTTTTTATNSLRGAATTMRSAANAAINSKTSGAANSSSGASMQIVAIIGAVLSCGCCCCCFMWRCCGTSPGSSIQKAQSESLTDVQGVDHAEVVREGTATFLTETFKNTVPQYWTNAGVKQGFDQMVHVNLDHHQHFDELLAATYHPKVTQDRLCPHATCPKTPGGCPCVQPGVGLPSGYRVRRVIRVEDSNMWDRYQKRLKAIKAVRDGESIHPIAPAALTDVVADSHPETFEPLDADINEIYAWHGTDVRAALSIAQDDFRIDLAGSGAGTMYGNGAYCAESSTKADEYAKDEPDGYYKGIFAMLLCRVCMGKMYYTTERASDAGEKVSSGSYDSTLGDRTKRTGTFREFVVYNADQLYPEYIVLYARMGATDDSETFDRAVRANPFHMELPIYWKNCHLNPNSDGFQIQCIVDARARGKLQELARACSCKNIIVKSARRIESASIWSKYVSFKRKLYSKLVEQHALQESEEEFVRMLGGSDQAIAPGKGGFTLPRHIDGTAVRTRRVLEEQGVSEALSTEYMVESLNEQFLWHGTSRAIAETIVTENFHIPAAGTATHGSRFGGGAYFAEDLDKSLQYAPCSNQVQWVLLCRVLGGSMHYTTANGQEDATVEAARLGHDSVLANPQGAGPREFIMLTEDQVYPEYILELEV